MGNAARSDKGKLARRILLPGAFHFIWRFSALGKVPAIEKRISVFRRRFELCANKRVSLTPRFNEGLSEVGGFSNRF
jgi:hypothetical protein